ncbi:MAG: hypothetical protein M1822_009048 [Bathelium mastoideum]|nr:MAG: hypothetical protein M1822_009048 [Bathelium mastoideum]
MGGAPSKLRKRDRLSLLLRRPNHQTPSLPSPSPSPSPLPGTGSGHHYAPSSCPPQPPSRPQSSSASLQNALPPLADPFLHDTLQRLSPQERESIQYYMPHGTEDIDFALRNAYTAAKKQQQLCDNNRWTWTCRGRMLCLRDEADKVTAFLDRFKSVGDIAANIDPVHVGLPWAGIRLILEVAISESRQMTALLTGLKTVLYMADRLRVYLQYLIQLAPSMAATTNFRNALLDFYAILLEFLAKALGSLQKNSPARIIEAVWSPQNYEAFSVKCDRIAQRTEIEARNCDRELDKQAHGILKQLQEKSYLGNLPVAGEAAFDSSDEGNKPCCLDQTRTELLEQIEQWVEDPHGQLIFWLKGAAGTGKSTISRTMAHKLKDRGQLASSFFFKRGEGDRSNTYRFFTTVALQLAEHLPSLRSKVAQALDGNSSVIRKTLEEQFEKLVLEPLSKAHKDLSIPATVVLVIDALDECERNEDIARILRQLERAKAVTTLRIFVTSRPDLPVELGFGEIDNKTHKDVVLHKIDNKAHKDVVLHEIDNKTHKDVVLHEINPSIIEHDITVYLKHQFAEIQKQRSRLQRSALPADWPGEKDLKTLVTLAVPLFIIAATICRFIQEPRAIPQDRLASLLASPTLISSTKLDDTYLPVLHQLIAEQDQADQDKFIRDFMEILGPIVTLAEPLSVCSISRLLKIPQVNVSHRLSWLHSVLDIPEDETLPVRLYHLSFREFLIDPQKHTRSHFWVNEQEMHAMLANACLDLLLQSDRLKSDICGLVDLGVERATISQEVITAALPADVSYACRYWVLHLEQSRKPLLDQHQANVFLQRHLLHWLEALSWLGRLSESVKQISILYSLAERGSKHFEFISDTRRFILQHRSLIDFAPLQLYSSALIFLPSASIVRMAFDKARLTKLRVTPQLIQNWSSELQKLEGHENWVMAVAFSPDGQLVASGSYDRTIRLWNTTTGEEMQKLEGHEDWVTAVAFSPDGQLMASGSYDRTIRLWNTTTGEEMQKLEGHEDSVKAVVFSPDGQLVASGSHDRTIRLWNTTTGEEMQKLEGHEDRVRAVAFSPDGQLVASGSHDRTIRLWNTTTGEEIQKLKGHEGSVTAVAFSPDGQLVASGSHDRTIRLWNTTTGEEMQKLEGHEDLVTAVAFSLDGQLVASGSDDQTIRLWNTTTGEEMQKLEGHEGSVTAVAFSPDGQLVASGSYDRTIRLWNTTTGEEMQKLEGHEGWVKAVAFSPDGQLVASGSDDRTIRLWNTTTGEEIQKLEGHEGWVTAVAFSPDGQLVASGSDDRTIRLWNTTTGEEIQKLKGHEGWVTAVAFSPDGQLVASRSNDRTIRLWNTTTGEEIQKLEGHEGLVRAVAFSPDGQLVASGSDDRTIRLWNTTTGEEMQKLEGHKGWVRAVAFSPDGQLVASGSDDQTIRLWNTTTGEEMQKLEGHEGWVTAVAFSADGKHLESNVGRFSISLDHDLLINNTVASVNCLDTKGRWVNYKGRRQIWLPHEVIPSCFTSHGNRLAIGHVSGRLTFFEAPLLT